MIYFHGIMQIEMRYDEFTLRMQFFNISLHHKILADPLDKELVDCEPDKMIFGKSVTK